VRGTADKIHHGLERIEGMVQQNILPPDGGEDILIFGLLQAVGDRRNEGSVFQLGIVQSVQVHQTAQPQRSADLVDLAGLDLQIGSQHFEHAFRHLLGDFQPDHGAESPLTYALLHRFQQVLGFEFLDGEIGVTRDAEGMGSHDLHSGKQIAEVGGDQLLQPHERDFLRWFPFRFLRRAR
jgi:hypothetical protein